MIVLLTNDDRIESLGLEAIHETISAEHVVRTVAPDEERNFFLQSSIIETTRDEGSEWSAISNGKVSISPMYLHSVNHLDHQSCLDAFVSGMNGSGRL